MEFPSFPAVPTVVPSVPYASFWRRLASNTIDSCLFWGVVLSWIIPGGIFLPLLIAFPLWVLKTIFYAVSKTSLGRIITKTRVYDLATGEITSTQRLATRSIAHIADTASIIGWFWPFKDARRQTFADKIMDTVVVRVDELAEQQVAQSTPEFVPAEMPFPQAS